MVLLMLQLLLSFTGVVVADVADVAEIADVNIVVVNTDVATHCCPRIDVE